MKRWFVTTLALLLIGFTAVLSTTPASAKEKGWTTLFDGKSLDNWDTTGTANWRLEKGAAVADKGNGFLVSKKDYKNYKLRVEFWYSEDANSGVFVHCTDPKTVTGKTSYEVNLWDTRPVQEYGTGAIVDLAKVNPMPHAAGKWSVYEITVKDDVYTVVLNGKKTVDGVKGDKFQDGRIALQHGDGNKGANGVVNDKGVVKFRKVQIKPL